MSLVPVDKLWDEREMATRGDMTEGKVRLLPLSRAKPIEGKSYVEKRNAAQRRRQGVKQIKRGAASQPVISS